MAAKMQMDEVMRQLDVADGKKQRRLICKRRRGGVVLSREQVKAIKEGRKLLKAELKARGIKDKEELNLLAASMGMYFDKSRFLLFWRWLFHGRGLWALLGAIAALMAALFLYSTVTQLRGHFTINMSADMFREGFVLSETEDFANPTTYLFCEPAVDVPCISISHLPDDLDSAYEGQHNADYFAYTFWVRNEGESTVGYDWEMALNSESLNLSCACWVMVFEDGEMLFYAEPAADGSTQTLPAVGDDTRGYLGAPLMELNRRPAEQYEVIAEKEHFTWYRVKPISFISESVVARGSQTGVAPQDTHKYTVVIWLEGDDPDCTNDLIGGHVGMEMNMRLTTESVPEEDTSGFWDRLKFWED